MAKKTADVSVPAAMFQVGAFPMICAKTGEPARERTSITATYTSPWAAVGIIGGVIGIALLAAILRKQLAGSVPLGPKTGPTQRKKAGYWMLGAAAIAFGSMFVLPSSVLGWGILAFALLAIVGGGLLAVDGERIQAVLASDQQTVTLRKVHPNFAEAVRHTLLTTSMYAAAYPSGAPLAHSPYQVAPPMPLHGSSGIPAPGPVSTPPPPGMPLPATAAAPAPGPTILDPFQS